MKRRVFTCLLALILVLVMCPVAPSAAATEVPTMSTEVCPCCGEKFSEIKWTSISGIFAKYTDLSKPGHYKIGKAFTENKEFTISGKVTIDFGGYKLQAKASSRGFVVKSGGMLTLLNSGGSNGRLEGHKTSAEGGAVKVEAGGTLNLIGGRIIGTSMSHEGGAIYNAGTVNIAGGKIDSGKITDKNGGNIYNSGMLNVYGGTITGGNAQGTANGGNIYNCGTLNIYGGQIENGTAGKYGGNIFNNDAGTLHIHSGNIEGGTSKNGGNIGNGGVINMHGGTVTAGAVTGDNGYGGNIYNSTAATINLYDGTISAGTAEDHGGNIFMTGSYLNVYGGTIHGGTVTGGTLSDGTAFTGMGGNIYATKPTAAVKIYGGTITGGSAEGSNGGNLVLISGTRGYMYGGTVENGTAASGGNFYISGYATLEDESKQYSGLYILSGTVTGDKEDIYKANPTILEVYSCIYTGSFDIAAYAADCTCCVADNGKYTIWNVGYKEGTCTDCLYGKAMAEELVDPVFGSHKFEKTGESTYTCAGCGKVRVVENVVIMVDGNIYGDVAEALADVQTGSVVKLMADANLSEVSMNGATLDLNGYTLTADVFTAAVNGSIIDTSRQNSGKLVCSNVSLAENNPNLPVTMEDGIHFCPVGFDQWAEPLDMNTTKVKFRFTQTSTETVIDNAINSGNTEVDVQIRLTWTDANGNAQDKIFVFGNELLKKYAEKWNSRVFVTTISAPSGISDLTYAYQVTSTATSGATLSAQTVKAVGYINDKLSWDKINAYPIKTSDMTVEEMRQLCVDFMEFNKTFIWTPDQNVDYIRNSSGTKDSMKQGTVYGGLPYVGLATGNPYRMMDYIDPNTGLVDMQKALPALGTKDRLETTDMKYFGNQCSICVYWGWGRVMNSTNYRWTSSAVPNNDFVILGDVVIPEGTKGWNATYGTDECVAANGEQVMFGGYAKLQKADGMVYYTTAGHLIMAYSDPVVVYNDDGTINGDESYIYIIDQGQAWRTATNEAGDTYQYKSSVNEKKTFTQLFNSNYIPFTFKEFLGTDPIEVTEVALVNGNTTLVSGIVSELDRSFQITTTKSKLTWSQLMASDITSNYGIVDAYIIIKDAYGNEIYKHAVRTDVAGNMALELKETGAMVTTWQTRELDSGKTYKAEIVVQLATGERPTIWSGQLTMDK